MKSICTTVLSIVLLLNSLTDAAQSTSAASASTTEEASRPRLEVPAGTIARLSLQTPLSSRLSEVNDEISALLHADLRDKDGNLLIGRGTEFIGRVTQVRAAERFQRVASITIVFERVRMPWGEEKISALITAVDDVNNDQKFQAKDDEGKVKASRSDKRTIENLTKGAQIGAIGGTVGGYSARSFGVFVISIGAGALAGALITKGNDIKLATGTMLRIRFERTLPVPATNEKNNNENKSSS